MKNQFTRYTLVNQDIDTSLLSLEMTWKGVQNNDLESYIGLKPNSFLEVINGQTINYYVDSSKINDFIKRCAHEVLNNEIFLTLIEKGTIDSAQAIRDYALDIYPNIDKYEIRQISPILRNIGELQASCAMYGTPFAFCDVQGDITNELISIVLNRKDLKFSVHDYTTTLGLPEVKSMTERAYEDIRNSNDDLLLTSKYFWLDQGYIGRGLTIEQCQEIRNTESPHSKNIDRDVLLKDLNLNEEELSKFSISQIVIAMKSLRIDSRQFLYVLLNKLIDIIASLLNIRSYLLEMMTIDELILLCDNPNNIPPNIQDRFTHSIFIPSGYGYDIILDISAQNFLSKVLEKDNGSDTKEIKGQVAQVGKVRGVAKIVFGPQHLKKVLDGDILISVVTSPQLLPAMKRAAAFVTDIGGITSHAAIVARELKKPCIIGTKIATKVLKDGDLVEVDANNGIVRILK